MLINSRKTEKEMKEIKEKAIANGEKVIELSDNSFIIYGGSERLIVSDRISLTF